MGGGGGEAVGADAGRADRLRGYWVALGRLGQVRGEIVLRCRCYDRACLVLAHSEQDFASLGCFCEFAASYIYARKFRAGS